jgi:adenylate cyclase
MKRVLVIVTITLLTINGYGQNQRNIDSIQNELNKFETSRKDRGKIPALIDSSKANLLYYLSKEYWGSNPDTAMVITKQIISLSEQIGYKRGLANAYNGMGVINMYKGDFKLALELYQKSLNISEEAGYKKGIATSYGNIALIYYNQGNYDEALKNNFDALKIRKEIGDKKGIGLSYTNIGLIYQNQGNFPEALKNQLAALKMQEETGDKRISSYSYRNIGDIYQTQLNYPEALKNYRNSLKICEEIGDKMGIGESYNDIGFIYYRQFKYVDALKNYHAALKIDEEIGNKQGIASSYYYIGKINSDSLNYPEALKNYFIALKIQEKIGAKNDIAQINNDIGEVYERENKLQDALKYESKGLSLALEIGALEMIKDAYGNLAEINRKLHDYKAADDNEVLYKQFNDSLFNQKNVKKFTAMQMQFDFDKKQNSTMEVQAKKDAVASVELKKQKQQKYGFSIGFAIMLVFAFVFLRQRNHIKNGKKKSDELLLNILPAEVAEELKDTGISKARSFDEVTVMFTDFKGFTQISEKLGAEKLVAEIDYCFSAFDRIIQKHGLEKIKTIGDSYMCVGGLPKKNKTHAADTVLAALEIRDFMANHNKEKIAKGDLPFEIRIGTNTGPVVAGIVGLKKFAYDIWGDTVNLASRMESSGKEGEVNISGSTYELVKDKFTCSHRGKIITKNKGEVDMYFVK